MLSGIPRESVLGSVLISVLIDDQEEGLMSIVLKFADETEIFRWVNSEDDHRGVLQEDLDRLVGVVGDMADEIYCQKRQCLGDRIWER